MLKIMFLNIFEGCREDDRLGLIAEYVGRREPDVLGVAELCGWRDCGRARMRHFADLTGLRHWVLCESRSTFDVGLLARRPLGPRITLREGVSNGLLLAEVPLENAEPIAVMVLHLSPGDEDTRRRELDAVASHAWGRDRLVVMGDMNALSPSIGAPRCSPASVQPGTRSTGPSICAPMPWRTSSALAWSMRCA